MTPPILHVGPALRSRILQVLCLSALAHAACGGPTAAVAVREWSGPADSGFALLHDDAICSMTITDTGGALFDLGGHWGSRIDRHMTRLTALAQADVHWSSRAQKGSYVTIVALPPGRYALLGYQYGPAEWAKDGYSPCVDFLHVNGQTLGEGLEVEVKPGELTLIGEIRCGDDRCTPKIDRSDSARRRILEVVESDLARPLTNDRALAIWRSWLPAMRAATARAGD
jgi:hypothetical protein